MNIEILSDGTVAGTRVMYRGEQLPGVQSIEYFATMEGIEAVITFVNVELDSYGINSNLEEKDIYKPVLGLTPRRIHNQQRVIEILKAMRTNNPIPDEWFTELEYLLKFED